MIEPRLTDSTEPSSSSGFVRKYLGGIFLAICLILVSVFWGFSYKANQLIEDQLRQQGQAFFQEIVLTRDWLAQHGGVYVPLAPGMEVNPYLLKVPGLKVVIQDQEGNHYTLKNPALVTREISEIAAGQGLFRFHITSLLPLNPQNAPDAFERQSLEKFARGETEAYGYVEEDGRNIFRYMAPLPTKESCMPCHAAQGYRPGVVRGGISVSLDATATLAQMRGNRFYLFASAIGLVCLIFAVILFISRVFIKDLKNAEKKLLEMATRDFLTGLLNRRETYRRLNEEFRRSTRFGDPLSVILLDIDYFKSINDSHGHLVGDRILQETAEVLRNTLREYDILCRYGGEEFLVGALKANLDQAAQAAERVRLRFKELQVPGEKDTSAGVTISAGVAQLRPGESIDGLIARADEALYRAKGTGRDRVVTSGESETP